ncbi:Cro/Cl family transcriptional regulator [Paeniglutamicibacter antarcticus]|uniref:Cro/Cl family transcriptional regulator n=1 Tax=Arthrobacter terrae TaxID=2935737 RepID=A0A931CM60_9MICC|nr:sugar-binding domain-containing protein [Arthrobacter terrae]MBG0740808.1 Cro/Cl family transcriptional regulator [Arthrobacter terrae]
MPQPTHEELLALIGKDYYLDNRSKVEIATSYGISRFQVARMLDEARAEGIVRIEVRTPESMPPKELHQLAAWLGIRKVIVIKTSGDDAQQRDMLARSVAKELMESVRAGMTLGISWSRTLDLAARYVTELPKCDIVQLAGALPGGGGGNPLDLIQRLGQASNGRTWPLWAPLVVDSAATAAGLKQQPEISQALRKADALDFAVIAIGAWAPNLSTVWDRVDNAVRQQGVVAGAVAECSGRLINAAGSAVVTELNSRILAVSLSQLKRTPTVVAVGHGAERSPAVRAAAAAGIVSTLIADESLAAALIRAKLAA